MNRRKFIGQSLIALSSAATAMTFGEIKASAKAKLADTHAGCVADCWFSYYNDCIPACKRKQTKVRRAICYSECMTRVVICMQLCDAEYTVRGVAMTAGEIADYVKAHPGLVVGAILVIGGVAYIVATGGTGALTLVVLA